MAPSSESPVTSTPSCIWDKAFSSLDGNLKAVLDATKTHKRDIVGAVLREVENKRQDAARRRWNFKKSNGEVVIVRDVLEKIAGWLKTFKEMGNAAVQVRLDPTQSWLPWAAVRFLLQAMVSDVELFGAVVIDLEVVSRLITWSHHFERQYLQKTKGETESLLDEALIRLCADILAYLARIVQIFLKREIVRILADPFYIANNEQMQSILARSDQVLKIASLIDTESLILPETTVTRLAVREDTCHIR